MNHFFYIFWAFFLTGVILAILGIASLFEDIKQNRHAKNLQE